MVPRKRTIAVTTGSTTVVAAFSVAPDTGLTGAPPGVDTSGQVWRLRF